MEYRVECEACIHILTSIAWCEVLILAYCKMRYTFGLQCNLTEFINQFAVLTFTAQVVIMHKEKISTHPMVLHVLNFEDHRKEGQ